MQLMKEITLSKGLTAKVDDADYEAVMAAGPWHAVKPSSKYGGHYAQRRDSRADGHRLQYMHTFLTGYRRTDHRNGDGLDNQRANLRETTQSQNCANAASRGGSSVYKGVTWDRASKRWRAQIMINRKQKYLGTYDDEVQAARAYDAAAREFQGEFARLNFKE